MVANNVFIGSIALGVDCDVAFLIFVSVVFKLDLYWVALYYNAAFHERILQERPCANIETAIAIGIERESVEIDQIELHR